MPPPLPLRLGPAAQAELEPRCQTTHDATTRTHDQTALLNAQGHAAAQVAQLTRRSPDTVRRALRRWPTGGLVAVPHRPHPGRPPHDPRAWEQELARVADCDPTGLGSTARCGATVAGRLPGR